MGNITIYNQKAPTGGLRDAGSPALQRPMDVKNTADSQLANTVLGSTAVAFEKKAREQEDLRLKTKVIEAANQYEAESRSFENDWYSKHQGASAMDAGKAFGDWHKEASTRYGQQFEGDARAASVWVVQSGHIANSSIDRGFKYAHEQDNLHRQDTLKGAAARMFQTVAETDDPRKVEEARQNYAVEARQLMPGRDISGHLAEVDSQLWENTINAKLAKGDVGTAQALLAEHRGVLGGRYDEVAAKVQRDADKVDVLAKGDQLAKQFGGNITGAISHIRATETNPDKRHALESFVKSEWSFREALEARAERESLKAERKQLSAALDGAQSPKDRAGIIANASPENQAWLMAYGRRLDGGYFETDKSKFAEAHRLISLGEDVDLSESGEYSPFINKMDRERLLELQGEKGTKSAHAYAMREFKEQWNKLKLPGTKQGDSNEKKDIFLAAQNKFIDSLTSKRIDNNEKADALLFETFTDYTVHGDSWYNFDRTEKGPVAFARQSEGKAISMNIQKAHESHARSVLMEMGSLDADGGFTDPIWARNQGYKTPRDMVINFYVRNRKLIDDDVKSSMGSAEKKKDNSPSMTDEQYILGE